MAMTEEERFRFDLTGFLVRPPATHNTEERFLANEEPPIDTDHSP